MAGGWQEGKEEKLAEVEELRLENEVILGPGPKITSKYPRLYMFLNEQ